MTASVPVHRLHVYVRRLVETGYKVWLQKLYTCFSLAKLMPVSAEVVEIVSSHYMILISLKATTDAQAFTSGHVLLIRSIACKEGFPCRRDIAQHLSLRLRVIIKLSSKDMFV